MDLGARPWQVFQLVTLPLIAQALVSAWLLTFTLSLDDVVLSAFLSGPGATTMPLVIFSRARLGLNPSVNAVATLIVWRVVDRRRRSRAGSGARRASASAEDVGGGRAPTGDGASDARLSRVGARLVARPIPAAAVPWLAYLVPGRQHGDGRRLCRPVEAAGRGVPGASCSAWLRFGIAARRDGRLAAARRGRSAADAARPSPAVPRVASSATSCSRSACCTASR